MTTSKTTSTTTSKTTGKNSKAGEVHAELLAKAVAAGANVESIEFELVQDFARVMIAGKLTVDGFRATVKEAKAKGAAFAFINESMAQHVETIANLAASDSTPRTMTLGELNTLAYRMACVAKPSDKSVSKQETARIESGALRRKSAKLDDAARVGALAALASKTNTAFKSLQSSKSSGSKSGSVTSVSLSVESVKALGALVQKAEGNFSDELSAALSDLRIVIEVWLGSDN